MCNLKRRFPTAPPPFGAEARLPALLALVLAGAVAVQLALPAARSLPANGAVAQGAATFAVAPEPWVPPVPGARALFTPVLGGATGEAASGPLGGAIVAGAMQRGRLRVAVVQMPAGAVRYVPPGGAVGGWRVETIGLAQVRLRRGREHLDIAYGMPAGPARPSSTTPKPEDAE